jgi:hypothetical protein
VIGVCASALGSYRWFALAASLPHEAPNRRRRPEVVEQQRSFWHDAFPVTSSVKRKVVAKTGTYQFGTRTMSPLQAQVIPPGAPRSSPHAIRVGVLIVDEVSRR